MTTEGTETVIRVTGPEEDTEQTKSGDTGHENVASTEPEKTTLDPQQVLWGRSVGSVCVVRVGEQGST